MAGVRGCLVGVMEVRKATAAMEVGVPALNRKY